MDTSDADVPPDRFEGGTPYPTVGRSVALFRLVHRARASVIGSPTWS